MPQRRDYIDELKGEQGLRTQKRLTLGDISHRIARGEVRIARLVKDFLLEILREVTSRKKVVNIIYETICCHILCTKI